MLTLKAADQGPEPLPEDEVAQLGRMIATERQLLVDAISGLLDEDDPEAAASPGVAEFDAGFLYGLRSLGPWTTRKWHWIPFAAAES